MRAIMIASAGLALVAGGGADAQQRIVQGGPGAGYGMPGRPPMVHTPPMQPGPVVRPMPGRPGPGPMRGQHWGSKVGGRWWGGANAPGGWSGYRRPHRGWALPSYWIAPRFYITDWAGYGLGQPPQGYTWTRYYDDAVLIDGRGSVYDSVDGVDWDRFDGQGGGGYYAQDDQVYAGPAERGGYAYDDRGDDRRRYDDRGPRRDDGVAGNVIAGRGNRLGGTLIGAGVGAAAGYAIDRSEDRGRRGPPSPPPPPPRGYAPGPHYGAGYPAPGYQPGYRGPAPGGAWVSPDGTTTVTTTSGYGGGYGGGSTTTVVVQPAPVVTTTTTTYYEDAVTYRRPVKVWKKKRVWRRPRCGC